jgi:cell division inhibitor SepF
MASMWRKSMLYLGLGPDEEYDDVDSHLPAHPGGEAREDESPVQVIEEPLAREETSSVRAMPVRTTREPNPMLPEPGTQEQAAEPEQSPSIQPTGSVRTIPVSATKPHVVSPRSFNDAQVLADRFKADQPVIVNLQAVDRDLSRRLIDFTSGLCYALDGNMEKVAESVYLLAPSNVQVPEEERRRLQERGLHS